MANQHAVPGAPSDEIVASVLLAQLRAEAGHALEFAEPLVPVTGGFETFTYGFRVDAEAGPLAGPLILRLLRGRGAREQVRREAAFQNALAGLGYPVPRVVMQVANSDIGGQPFNVMERVAGRPMLAELFDGTGDLASMPGRLAGVQAQLHAIPSRPVIEAVEAYGFSAGAFSIWGRLEWLGRYFEEPEFERLRPVWDWLRENRPVERETPAVCHGDFHPGNVMMDGRTVSGVIDWPGASFADAEHDVAVTLVLVGTVSGGLFPDFRGMLQGFRTAYVGAYEERRALDHSLLDYYEVMRMFIGFVRGTAAVTPGEKPELAPRGGYPWADAWVMRQGAMRIAEITGLALPLPGNT